MTLDVGSKAPDFELPTDDGGTLTLATLHGAGVVVVLYFYPKDDTPGCTNEAKDFSALKSEFGKAGAVVIGASKDTVAKHAKFRAKYELTIPLGSDPDGTVIQAYDSWIPKVLYGREYMGIDRATFLIDAQGVIRRIWRKVKVAGHAAEVLAAVKALG